MSMRVGNRYPTTTAYNYTPHPDHHPNPSMASSGHRYGHSTASSSGAVASTSSSTTVNTNMNANVDPQVINVHTPTYAYAILHAAKQESLSSLLAKLASKQASIHGHGQAHIGRGWVKYEWNDSLWNLDDDSDYTIFIWRFSNHPSPTLHIHDPSSPLPNPNEDYINSSFFLFRPPPPPSKFMSSEQHAGTKPARSTGTRSTTSKAHSKRSSATASPENRNGVTLNGVTIDASGRPTQKFKNEQGVRTVIGSIGPVKGVRMLLKEGYRHVYISRIFAALHGFIPKDATPGNYGYGGIVHIGQFPIRIGTKTTTHPIYLTEEKHFDVILGRSFIEKRGVQMDSCDVTHVVCRDTGEELDIEVVVLRDGRGEVVTIT